MDLDKTGRTGEVHAGPPDRQKAAFARAGRVWSSMDSGADVASQLP